MASYLPLFTLLVAFIGPTLVSPAKILDIAFVTTKSHKITVEPLLLELAKRGHEITRVSPYVFKKPVPNIREIMTMDVDEGLKAMPNMFEMKERNEEFDPFKMARTFCEICRKTYDLPHIQEFIANVKKEKYDLILYEAIFNECIAGLVHQLNTSVILISPAQLPAIYLGMFGNPSPPSFIPSAFTTFSDEMNFYERVLNFLSEGFLRLVSGSYFQKVLEQIYFEKLGPNLPTAKEVYRNASLILQNSHISLNKPKPLLPDIIDIGGMHCKPAEPLPKDLAEFADSSGPDGFIYFSMGSALNATLMQDKYRKIFLNTFAKLKQKVLWKWETETMEGLPRNVKLRKWLPQQDVLGHPNIKAFIMHGGYGGVTEGVYHGVPLIGLLMFGDQPLNMRKAEAAGYAITLDFITLTEEKLTEAINKILTEPTYRDTVQHLSRVFKDQPIKPLDLAVYWVEYVIRHKGATPLRSAARKLNSIQYHSLDVIALLAGILGCFALVLVYIFKCVCRKLFAKSSNNGRDHQLNKNGTPKKNR